MYKYKKLLLTFLALSVAGLATAKPIDPAAAARIATDILQKKVVNATPESFTECYLFVGVDGYGFALVAADDCVPVLLGYSLQGVFPTDEPLPHHVDTWIKAYQFDIAANVKSGTVVTKYNTTRDTAVGPLMTTTWNQSPYYDDQCPYDTNSRRHAVTGCVATATAQIMKYWNHPTVGRGSHSYASPYGPLSAQFDATQYDWGHMPNRLNGHSSETELAAVAQLMYHVGVAVEMNYGTHGSSANVSAHGNPNQASSENALKNYFRYNQGLFTVSRDNYSNAVWDSILTAELDASRPILFSGRDNDGGHAFVIDGYDSLGLYHVNWGWGGYCDGYYTFDNLSPTGSGIGGNPSNSYSYDNRVLVHVFPASETPTVTVNIVSADTLSGTVSGGGTFTCYTPTTLFAIAAEGYRFFSWKSGNRENPIYISPNNNFGDTALFLPLEGDTIGYSQSVYSGLWGEYSGVPTEWAIRIPASVIAPRRQLNAVQFYGVPEAEYTVKIFDGPNFDRMVYSTNVTTGDFGWLTVPLPIAFPLIDDNPIWIYLTSRSYSNPAVYSTYSGNSDGSWYKRAGTTWEHLEDRNEYKSWMIRAILGDVEQVSVTAEPNDPSRGSVSGGGLFFPGDTAVFSATPADGYRFVAWSTGERTNPLYLRVTEAVNLIAIFSPRTGIDSTPEEQLSYCLNEFTLTVKNPMAELMSLYDIQGRLLATSRLSSFNYQFSIPGVYLLKVGELTHKIVVR